MNGKGATPGDQCAKGQEGSSNSYRIWLQKRSERKIERKSAIRRNMVKARAHFTRENNSGEWRNGTTRSHTLDLDDQSNGHRKEKRSRERLCKY